LMRFTSTSLARRLLVAGADWFDWLVLGGCF
jgi:hypothetical protein